MSAENDLAWVLAERDAWSRLARAYARIIGGGDGNSPKARRSAELACRALRTLGINPETGRRLEPTKSAATKTPKKGAR